MSDLQDTSELMESKAATSRALQGPCIVERGIRVIAR